MAIVAIKDVNLIGPEDITRSRLINSNMGSNGHIDVSDPLSRNQFLDGKKAVYCNEDVAFFVSQRVLLHGAGFYPAVLRSDCKFCHRTLE
jgi:hypothetical protein